MTELLHFRFADEELSSLEFLILQINMPGLSFKFSKTSEKKVLLDSKLSDSSTKDNNNERDFIKDVTRRMAG